MEDKVKEFRDKNPILDFLAGFIPGLEKYRMHMILFML